jgi:hypothetical protein
MSALCQKRTFSLRPSVTLFDHLVGAGNTVSPSAFALHRHTSRVLALEDTVDIASGAPALIGLIRSVGDETAGSNERPVKINSRQPPFSRKLKGRDECTPARSPQ